MTDWYVCGTLPYGRLGYTGSVLQAIKITHVTSLRTIEAVCIEAVFTGANYSDPWDS